MLMSFRSGSFCILVRLIATIVIAAAYASPSSAGEGTTDPAFNAGGVGPHSDVVAVSSAPESVCSGAPDSIISWWPGEGNAQDIVGHYDGTLQNGATFGTGLVGQAFSLDGLDDAILVNDTAALNPTSITVEAWVKPDSVPTGALESVVTKWGFDATIDSYFLGLINSGGGVTVIGAIGDGATGDSGFRGGTITLNAWSHIAMTYDAASGLNRLYLNGVAVGERVRANGIYPTTSRVFIGREDSSNNRFFSGLIDEPTIYGRPLTDAEILAIYNAGSDGKCASPTVPAISLSSTSLSFTAAAGGGNPTDQTVTVSNAGGGTLIWTAGVASGAGWLSVSPGTGTDTGTLTISVNIAGLAANSYNGSIEVADPAASNTPRTISVQLTVAPQAHPPSTISDLIARVQGLSGLNHGQLTSLLVKLRRAQSYIQSGSTRGGCMQLDGFIKDIERMAHLGFIDAATANELIGSAQAIEASLGCS